MASYPKFSSPSATDVTLSKGLQYPYNKDGKRSPNQLIGKAVGGAVKVYDFDNVEHFWTISVKYENETNRDALLAFWESIDYAANTFTFYPEGTAGTPYTVRLWDIKGIDYPSVSDGNYNIQMTLRKEIT